MACTAPRHCKVFFSVAHAEISCRMPAKLVFTASLCKKETKSDHLAFLAVQAVAGIIVSKAVVRQPAVNVSAKRRAIRLALRHIGAKQLHLFGKPSLKPGFLICGCLRRKWQPDAMLLHNPVRSNEKITGAADPKIGRCLIDGLLDRNGVNPYIQCCVEHVLKFAHALAAKQGARIQSIRSFSVRIFAFAVSS